jgi:LEA14-like dessication related protein
LKPAKILGVFIAVVQLASVLAFVASMYTVTAVLSSSLSGEGMALELTVDESTGVGTLQLELYPINPGFLSTDLSVELILLADGEDIASDSSSVSLAAGSQETMSLELTVDAADMEQIITEGLETSLEVTFALRTLYDLVGISNKIEFQGGVG